MLGPAAVLGSNPRLIRLQSAAGSDEEWAVFYAALQLSTSFAFLLPAAYAARAGRPWHAGLFTVMATICIAYHFCDEDAAPRLFRMNSPCSARTLFVLTRADHLFAYYCFVQMGFLVLGPEDRRLQWIHVPTMVHARTSYSAVPVPTDVLVAARIVPLVTLIVFAAVQESWHDFHWQASVISVALLLIGNFIFWSRQERVAHAPRVLLHAAFWKRAWWLYAAPQLLCMIFIVSGGSNAKLFHSAWHVVLSMLVTLGLHCVYKACDPFALLQGLDRKAGAMGDVLEMPPQNPLVVQWILFGLCFIPAALVCAVLFADASMLGGLQTFRWPVLGVDALPRPLGYASAMGFLCLLAAWLSATLLVGSVTLQQAQNVTSFATSWAVSGKALRLQEDLVGRAAIELSRLFSCLSAAVGCLALMSCAWASPASAALLGSAAAAETVKLICVGLALGTSAAAVVLTTVFGSRGGRGLGVVPLMRMLLALAIASAAMSFGCAAGLRIGHLWDRQVSLPFAVGSAPGLAPTALDQQWMAGSQYVAIILTILWPLTWWQEVRDRWECGTCFGSRPVFMLSSSGQSSAPLQSRTWD